MSARSFGSQVKERREEKGLNQGELAKQLGWTHGQFISNIERGVCNPPLAVVPKLCRLLGFKQAEVYKHLYQEELKVLKEKYQKWL